MTSKITIANAPTSVSEVIAYSTLKLGGGTFPFRNPLLTPRSGYAVSTHKELELKVRLLPQNCITRIQPLRTLVALVNAKRIARAIRAFTLVNVDVLRAPGRCLGTWIDKGILYVDTSVVVQSLDEALAIARANNQLAVFDIQKGKSVTC
jgi:hypothetical protein